MDYECYVPLTVIYARLNKFVEHYYEKHIKNYSANYPIYFSWRKKLQEYILWGW